MNLQLKPIKEQVLVIAGASSGIGLVTAKLAAERGAQVVLAARNEGDLASAVDEIRRAGGRAAYVVADVADPQAVEGIAERALREFGRNDTWVNNAAVALYGCIMDLSLEDMRRQFDVNYWGQVHGCRTAVRHLRKNGGAIINMASDVADRALPLQGNYSAAKHALKAFTDALRMELEAESAPISLTLVKPGSIDTPLFDKAKTLLGVEPQPVPPVYAPEIVAQAIIECAHRPVRDIIVGGMGKVLSTAEQFSPRLTDLYMERTTFESQKTDKPVSDTRRDNLSQPLEHDGGERGHNWTGRVKHSSAYTAAVLHPGTATLAAAGVGLVVAAGIRALRARTPADEKAASKAPAEPSPIHEGSASAEPSEHAGG